MISEKHIIKVDQEITPIHYTKRTEPELKIGADYYVCFGNNVAFPCTLKEIIGGRNKRVVITNMIMIRILANTFCLVMKLDKPLKKQSEILRLFEKHLNIFHRRITGNVFAMRSKK